MTFVHEDADFQALLNIVARERGIVAALVEKDYWVTHTLWALHRTGLEVWFKGGTSLSKGFGLIRRFSEDLDLMIRHGSVKSLPKVTNWASGNKKPITERRAFYVALAGELRVPDVPVERDLSHVDKQARGADYLGHYPGAQRSLLPVPSMRPFVRIEVGSARVVPYVERVISSFVHDYLDEHGGLEGFEDNRAKAVRCAHPLVTLLEKIDAVARRYVRDPMDADTFIRHYEDAARIIQAADALPPMGSSIADLVADMLARKDIAAMPRSDHPSFLLAGGPKTEAVTRAYEQIAPMFWGPRLALGEACRIIRSWLDAQR